MMYFTVIRCVAISANFRICTIVGLNWTFVEAKISKVVCPKCVFEFQQVSALDPGRCKCQI
jgi:hypothetical protein